MMNTSINQLVGRSYLVITVKDGRVQLVEDEPLAVESRTLSEQPLQLRSTWVGIHTRI